MGQGRRTGLRRTAAAGALSSSALALSLAWASAPAAAQEAGGPLFTMGVSTAVRASDNLDLNPVSNGATLLSETRLSFGFESVTRTQEFYIRVSDTFEFGFGDDAPDGAGFNDTDFEVGYSWQGKNAAFDANARIRLRDLGEDILLLDVDDPSSTVVLDAGTLEDSVFNLRFEVGLNDPFGAEVRLSHSRLNYSGTSDPDVVNSNSTNATVSAIFRPNQVTETRLSYSHTFLDIDDVDGTERTTRRLTFGGTVLLDPVTTVSASIGWSQISEELTAVPLTLPDSNGFVASLAYNRELPAGDVGLSFDYSLTQVGQRADVTLTRNFELPTGGFGFEIGVTAIEGDSMQTVGGINYLRQWPDQAFRVNLTTAVVVEPTTSVRRRTQASVEYEREINELESLEFGVAYAALTDGGGGAITDRTQITASASYTRELTRDWVLETGYVHRFRMIEGSPNANSNEIFVRLGRDFSWRP